MTRTPPRADRTCTRPLLALAAVVASGCTFLGGERAAESVERAVASAGDAGQPQQGRTIPLELTFVRCEPQDPLLGDELWRFVDEQALPADVRGRLAANGLRVGVVGGHLPPQFATRFAPAPVETAAGPLPTDAAVSRRLMRLLPGRRGEIVTATGVRELVLLEHADGEVRGGSFRDANPLFALSAWPAADGRVRVEVAPEIRHGPVEKSWVGEAGMFRLEAGQRRHPLDGLRFSVTLPHDGLLLVGCGGAEATAGDCLLRDHDRGRAAGLRLLAIRPLGDAVDPLFGPEPEAPGVDDPPLVVR